MKIYRRIKTIGIDIGNAVVLIFDAIMTDSSDYDYLSLHLTFYLARWGMYGGSSFLFQKDYKIHIPVVKQMLNKK